MRRIGASSKAALESAKDTGRALRSLVSADLALARSAIGRALAWVAVGIVFGASTWLLVVGALTLQLGGHFVGTFDPFEPLADRLITTATHLAGWR